MQHYDTHCSHCVYACVVCVCVCVRACACVCVRRSKNVHIHKVLYEKKKHQQNMYK